MTGREKNYFYKKHPVEKIRSADGFTGNRAVALGRVARVARHLPDFFCLDPVDLAGIGSEPQTGFLRLYLYRNVHLECADHLVDLECFGAWLHRGLCGQQLPDVFALAGI